MSVESDEHQVSLESTRRQTIGTTSKTNEIQH